MSRTALLLIAHGSRSEEANAELYQMTAALKQRGHAIVEPAFLELAEPTIDSAAAACLAAGAQRVVLLPYFLSAGMHVKCDLSAARDNLAGRHPDVKFVLAESIGPHPLLVDILQEKFAAAISSDSPG